MMKIYFPFLFCLLVFVEPCSAFVFKARAAGFFPNSPSLKKIYGSSFIEGQVEASIRFSENISFFANTGYVQKEGKLRKSKDKTRFQLIPTVFGASYQFFPDYSLSPYLGLGAGFSYVTFRNHTKILKKFDAHTYAIRIKSGFYYTFTERFLLDIFFDYLISPFHVSSKEKSLLRSTNFRSFQMGIGIGYIFC